MEDRGEDEEEEEEEEENEEEEEEEIEEPQSKPGKAKVKYNFKNMPPVEDASEIKWINRQNGRYDWWIFFVFHCKDDCKTILTFNKT